MSLNPLSLLGAFIFGVIGFWLIKEAKRRGQMVFVPIGIALMIYPYFVETPLAVWGIGAALCGAARYFW